MKKNLLYVICAICVVCGLCACDDFLDTDNLTKKDTSNFPVSESDAVQMVNGIYAAMNRNLADPEEDPFFIFDIASDDRLGGGSQSNIGAQGVDRLMNAYLDWMKPLWKQRYAGINRANNALETIDNVTEWSSPEKKNQLLCETYFLRACIISIWLRCSMVYLWYCQQSLRICLGLQRMRCMPRLPLT